MATLKEIILQIIENDVDITELDKHIAEGWQIVSVSPDTINNTVKVRLEKDG